MSLGDIKKMAIEGLSKLPRAMLPDVFKQLLNALEDVTVEKDKYKEENQKLRDENNRLKGEKGKPSIKPPAEKPDEEGAKQTTKVRGPGVKGAKRGKISITRTEKISIDRAQLPVDARYKGTRSVVIQDIAISPDNVEFVLERFHSPELGKTYESELPAAYRGHEFGPHLRAFVITLHYQCRITQKVLYRLLSGMGILISEGQIGEILLDSSLAPFYQEKEAARQAGIEKHGYQQIDDTGARMNGENYFTIVTCNEDFSSFLTSPSKDRMSALRGLVGGTELKYAINDIALAYIRDKISNTQVVEGMRRLASARVYSQFDFDREVLQSQALTEAKAIWKKYIVEGCAIGAYHAGLLGPRAPALICDDAPQFKGILEYLGLCWIHEGRHYKKLEPRCEQFQYALDEFLDLFWKYYDQLKDYRKSPSRVRKKRLKRKFDELFTPDKSYYALNHLIKKTRKKRAQLLLVLDRPEIPLHNNGAELDIREKVIQRKIRNCFRSLRGAYASDTFLSLLATCRKQSIFFWEYVRDRILKTHKIQPLAELIRARLIHMPA